MDDKNESGGIGPSDETTTGRKPIVVAIGASAGGVQALQALFDSIPAKTGAAFVVVMHLDPNRRSELAEILAARASMPVVRVEKSEQLEADHIYVIPPDRRLQVVDQEISALEFDQPHGQRAPIDLFFRSVAEQLSDGIAVVLSGAGSDGAIGVRAIKESGGIVLVQDPNEAEYGSMPRSAIATGVADFVLPVRDLASRLVDLVRIKHDLPRHDPVSVDEEFLHHILSDLRVRTGHDFTGYKKPTVLRRIARRMQVTRTRALKDYYDFLQESPGEAQALLGDLLISVTTFFRDAKAFEALSKKALPGLFKGKDAGEPIRVWICGCATGEEAYTMAILLLEEAVHQDFRSPLQIFGSDLDAHSLAVAREARYPVAIETDVSEERLHRFFLREGDHYRVRQEVRDIVLFAVHDVIKDPPFSHVDLISCRNVLIYLDSELQDQVCNTFHYALNPGGFLLLGASEVVDHQARLFHPVDPAARLYRSTIQVGQRPRVLPQLPRSLEVRNQMAQLTRPLVPSHVLGEAALHRQVIEKVAPPSILVDEAHRVVHLSNNAGRYLSPAGGSLSNDVADLARPELRFELRSALHRAFEHNQPTLTVAIPVRFDGVAHRVHLLVKPGQDGDVSQHAIVMFIEGDAIEDSPPSSGQQATDETVRRLTHELEMMQSRLRAVREESDTVTEELRIANEELQSINEEYRSTSEELETSKEELQSINEELQTVNSELKLKLEAISQAHSDLQNLMMATDVGILFLDSNLRIKRFTNQVTDMFSITPADEGRPITDFTHQLEYERLVEDAHAVLAHLTPLRRAIHSRTDRWYDIRLRPYRTIDNKIDGVVITFVDVTERQQIEEALRESERQLRQQKRLVELSRDPIFIWDFDGGIIEWNRGCEELYGYTSEEVLRKEKDQLLETTVPGSSFAEVKSKLLSDGSWSGELHYRTKDGRVLTVETQLDLECLDGRLLVLESTRDVTERKLLQERQQLLLRELTHRVKNMLAVIQSMAYQTLRHNPSGEEFIERFTGRLHAMANAHELLVLTEWGGADVASLARVQLEAYASGPDRLHIEGPPVLLPASLSTPFALVLHELATNAAKYGSLSLATGTVSVSWTVSDRDGRQWLILVWREAGGPAVQERARQGLGSTLIENAIPKAAVRREFHPQGLVCTIEVALPRRESFEHSAHVYASQ